MNWLTTSMLVGLSMALPISYEAQVPDQLMEVVELKQALDKRDKLLGKLFNTEVSDIWLSMPTTITWYSLSIDETDSSPDQAAHGKSRPFMAALSQHVIDALGLSPGDKLAVLSDDGEVAAVIVYWDRKNARYDNGSWVDIVAPSKKVALRWGVRPGKLIKL